MCLNSLHISTGHSRYYNPDFGLLSQANVPCNSCLQCVMSNHNDLFLRTKAEYVDTIKSCGAAIFLTFTYSEDTVPYKQFFLDDDGIVNLVPVPRFSNHDNVLMCFDKKHMQNYLKSLREQIFIDYGLRHSLRYICVPEYGSQFTQRPHYHCIFFIHGDLFKLMCPDGCSNDDIDGCQKLLDYFSKFWSYGIVSASDAGLFINSESCMSYVTKYVCKNSDLLKYTRFRNFFDAISDWHADGRLCPIFGHDFKSPMSYFLYYCKFFEAAFYVVKSLYYGVSMVNDFPIDDPKALVDKFNAGIPVYSEKSSDVRYLKVPKYIKNKILYNHRSDGSYYLNAVGLRTIDYLRYSSVLDTVDAIRAFDWSLLDSVPVHVFTDYNPCLRYEDFDKYIVELLSHAPVLTVYGMYYRSRLMYHDYFDESVALLYSFYNGTVFLEDVISRLNSMFVDFFPDDYVLPLDSPRLSDYFLELGVNAGKYFSCFSSDFWDLCLDFWTVLSSYCRATVLQQYKDENDSVKLLSDILNSKRYGI